VHKFHVSGMPPDASAAGLGAGRRAGQNRRGDLR